MMAPKTIADIPTIAQLYAKSTLRAASAPIKPPSASLNERVGLYEGDITRLALDAIVNAANKRLRGGGGVDGAIHRVAGPGLLAECRPLKGCEKGMAKITPGFKLPAKYVIHTVGPIYYKEDPWESERLLESCYKQSLKLAIENNLKTIAFSGISTGLYGYPSHSAAETACRTVREVLLSEQGKILQRVVFVTFSPEDVDAYNDALPKYFPPAETME